ncbi:MAG: WecB/TagA/CpsF family glycosyltransferase [Candidatus Marinimicrobia bacterium]|nr:WecB/TagA/CpsF family glycosyltransferase [Candidatus Neomarinimicrobiota bacterium]
MQNNNALNTELSTKPLHGDYKFPTVQTYHFWGTRVDSLTKSEALEAIHSLISQRRPENISRPAQVYFTNVHTIHLARKDPEFHRIIEQADLVLPDGSGLDLAGRLFRKPIRENLNGTDLTPEVLGIAEEQGWSVYLLGAKPNVMNNCVRHIRRRFPDLILAGHHHGYFDEVQEKIILREIFRYQPDIVLVGMGAPLQEKWITNHLDDLEARICFGVGGLFDFLGGEAPRAPRWMRNAGIEWVYRFLHQPKKKWNRVFVEIPLFLGFIFVNWLRMKSNAMVETVTS